MKFEFLIIALIFISCREIGSSKAKDISSNKIDNATKHGVVSNNHETNVIDFDFNFFKKIDNYKIVDFESDLMMFDRLLIADTTNIDCYSSDNNEQFTEPDNTFYINTDYGKIRLKSINDGDMFYQYSVINEIILDNYVIIRVSTIDASYTVFLNKKKYEGFRMSGEVYFLKDKNYLVSVSNTADYCLLEFYKIDNMKIINIANLYSRAYFIDCIKWEVDKLLLTIAYSSKYEYYKISWSSLLKTFSN